MKGLEWIADASIRSIKNGKVYVQKGLSGHKLKFVQKADGTIYCNLDVGTPASAVTRLTPTENGKMSGIRFQKGKEPQHLTNTEVDDLMQYYVRPDMKYITEYVQRKAVEGTSKSAEKALACSQEASQAATAYGKTMVKSATKAKTGTKSYDYLLSAMNPGNSTKEGVEIVKEMMQTYPASVEKLLAVKGPYGRKLSNYDICFVMHGFKFTENPAKKLEAILNNPEEISSIFSYNCCPGQVLEHALGGDVLASTMEANPALKW